MQSEGGVRWRRKEGGAGRFVLEGWREMQGDGGRMVEIMVEEEMNLQRKGMVWRCLHELHDYNVTTLGPGVEERISAPVSGALTCLAPEVTPLAGKYRN